ncbi:ribosome-binding factor A [Mesomycoplasma conjunctivae]|uniref:Ribosome-binding factor A n=1 Tax=Mesomycoplasma conjunctivae (strain ATCC 25834 / NCTC 10147 / HRC/581) TaxID=572263 RepID=C5J6X8_MESCH|nr:ribosome-binding factor A [Mesomycoplasma conjunctivae]CAT05241.1 Ribosome-binding factor A [Mesomycoplasma conjunctivae]VEU66462.1 ribosome-binding factor A [Mesomycoplasma conjunctivae]
MSISHEKRETHFLYLISEILYQNFAHRFDLNVNWVKLSGDYSHLNIYLEFNENEDFCLEQINKANKFIRFKLAKISVGYKVPQLHFYIDHVSKRVENIDKILSRITNEK